MDEDIVERIREITGRRGVDMVLDHVGADLDHNARGVRAGDGNPWVVILSLVGLARHERTLDRVGRALVYGLGVSSLLLSASVLIAAVVVDLGARDSFSETDIVATVIAVGSAMIAAMLLGGLTWNLFVRDLLARIRWARFLGLLPVIGKYFSGGTKGRD